VGIENSHYNHAAGKPCSLFSLIKVNVTARRALRSEFLRHGAVVFAATTLVNALNFLYHMLAGRVLGVDRYGALATLSAVFLLATIPGAVLNMTAVKHAAELYAIGDKERIASLSRVAVRLGVVVGGILVLAFALAGGGIASYLRLDDVWTLGIMLVAVCAWLFLAAARGILQGVHAYNAFSFSLCIEGIVKVGAGIGLAAHGFGVRGAAAGFALGAIAALAYTQAALARRFPRVRSAMNLNARRLVVTSTGVAGALFATTGLGFLDVLLTKHYFDPHTAGLFGVLSMTGKVIMFMVAFAPAVMLPKATDCLARGQSPRRILAQAAAATGALSTLVLALAFVAPSLLVRIMGGNAYLAVTPYVFSYACAMALLGATTLVSTYKIGLHRFGFIPALFAVMAAEITGIGYMHRTIADVVCVLLVGNALAFAATLYRVADPVPTARLERIGAS
jgi:O-antigen/teichoic acid export membrane protein